MNVVSTTVSEGKKEACKTYIEQTKLLVTLASAFLFAPAALVTILNNKDAADLDSCVLTSFLIIEVLFVCSVLFGYIALGCLAGSQDDGSFDVFRKATRIFSLLQFVSYVIGIGFFVAMTAQIIGK
jgi:hypothetical protein